MPQRPYFCEKCHATFKTPSGREWHIAHRHDAPATLESIRREYNAKADKLMADNRALASKNDQMQSLQLVEKVHALSEQANNAVRLAELLKENNQLEHEKNVAMLALIFLTQGMGQP